ncbi:hypothetical protein ACHAQA_002497 [Verticillium albo-atrum]
MSPPSPSLDRLLDPPTASPLLSDPLRPSLDTPEAHDRASARSSSPSSSSPLDALRDTEATLEPLSGPSSTYHATTASNALDPSIASSSNPSRSAARDPSPSPGPVIEMEPMTGVGHRRRRSSLMQSVGASTPDRTARPRAQSLRTPAGRAPGGLTEEPKISEEAPDGVASASADPADDSFSDEDLHDDEETGLTKKDQRRKRQKKRRNTLLDQRIARGGDITAEEKEADQNVFRNLAINSSLILLWYIFSLSISLYNKWMFDKDRLNFAFPLFTTSCHMLVQFALSALVLFFVPSLRPQNAQHNSDAGRSRHETEPERPLMSKLFYLTRIGPCGAATGLDIGLGNTSLKFITLTFYTMCKSSSLAFVLIFAFLFRLEKPTWRLVAIIAAMTFGVILMVSGEVEFKLGGFVLVISAAFFSGFRWALTQILLLRNPATSNPFSSIFFLAPVMFVVLMAIAIPVEGFPALIEGLKALVKEWGVITTPLFLLFPGCIAFLMTASEFALLQRTSVVTLSIAGIFKEVVTISAAALVFEDHLTPVNAVGLVTTIIAIAAYNWMKIRQMRQDAQDNVHRGHMDVESTSSHSGSDNEDAAGENAGLLARNSVDIDENLVTIDGDIIPNPAQEAHQEAQGSRIAQAHRDN